DLFRLLQASECRLLALVGPGGIGKSQLALQCAREQTDFFPDGVFVILLAPQESPEQIPSAIAEPIGLKFHGASEPATQLSRFLEDKQMLIVLDNFEQLKDGADIVTQLLGNAPQVKFIVTSRERLNLRDEVAYGVNGLSYPPEEDNEDFD